MSWRLGLVLGVVVVLACISLVQANEPGQQPVRQWMAVFSGDEKPRLISGEHQDLSNSRPSDLVASVSEMPDGTIISQPLQAPGVDELTSQSSQAALDRVAELKRGIEAAKLRSARLQAEIDQVTAKVRKAAGYDEIDKIYDRAAALELEIEALRSLGAAQ